MSNINIYKENNKIVMKSNDKLYLFSLDLLMKIISENSAIKIVLLNLPGSLATQICKYLSRNGMSARSYNAFTNKDSKYIIKLSEKEKKKSR